MPGTDPRVCVVGSSNIDLTFRTARLPQLGETLAGRGFQLGYGGKGANQAVMAARLGARVAMVSRVGRDLFGESLLHNFSAQGIDTTHVRLDDTRSSGVASIVVDDAAQNCILIVPGANHGLSPWDVQDAAAAIRAADILLCQLEVPVESTREALRLAKAAGVLTLLNPAPAVALPDEILQLADLCVPNESELGLLTSQAVNSLEEVERAAQVLRARGPRTLIVTLGSRGALLVDEQGSELILAVPVEAVDSSGAGDAFIGSLAVFVARGLPLREAARQANAVAALSVTRLGTQAAFPQRADAEAFLTGLAGTSAPTLSGSCDGTDTTIR